MPTTYTTKSGEITSKEELIGEIENLLNQFSHSGNKTILSYAVMQELSCEELENMRDNLLQKDHIAQHTEWLLGLNTKL